MSKFALLYDFVPIALFPFMIKNQNILIRKKSFNLQLLLWTNAIIITIFSLLFYYPIISFLSDNKLKNPIISVLPYLLAGSIVSITSYPIQRSVSDSILGLRARVSIWMLATNISMTWIFLPIFGASVAYTMTGFTTALYAGILARYNTNQIRQEGTDEP